MINVNQVLNKKGYDYFYVTPKTIVNDALKKMDEKNIGALLVIEKEKILGIFSERDFARKSLQNEKSLKDLTVDMFMSKIVFTISPEKSIYDCMEIMSEKHIRHLPVVENNKTIGLVSIGDIVNAVVFEQKNQIKQLENYITGSGYEA
jgi:CBS domain-containing protein